MTIEKLKNYIHEMDILLRPVVLFINPADESIIKEALRATNRENDFLIQISEGVTRNKIIMMDRKELEKYLYHEPPINLDQSKETYNCNNCKHQPGPLLMCDWMKTQPMVPLKCPRWEARTK